MKTNILISIICTCSLFQMQAQEKWGYDNTFEKESINKIWTQGLDTVYVVGANLIAMSIDRGRTWDKQYINRSMMRPAIQPVILTDIIFCNQKTGFVIDEHGTILKTINGGNTWERKADLMGGLCAIACTGLDNIWIVGYNGIIYNSTDFGETWHSMVIDTEQNKYSFNSVAFKDDVGYIAGGEPAVLYKTEDKGQTWIKQLTTDVQYGSYFSSLFLTDNRAYMGLTDYTIFPSFYRLFQTQDYQSWHEISLNFFSAGVSFLDDAVGYSFNTTWGTKYNPNPEIHIFKTENGGNDWNSVEVDYGPTDYFNEYRLWNSYIPNHHIQLVNGTIGYAVSGGVFCRTPLPDYDSWVNIKGLNISDSFVLLYNRDSNLLIKSQKIPIAFVQITDISGKILTEQRWNGIEEYEKEINISVIPKGLYLVKTILFDNSVHTNKWIKF